MQCPSCTTATGPNRSWCHYQGLRFLLFCFAVGPASSAFWTILTTCPFTCSGYLSKHDKRVRSSLKQQSSLMRRLLCPARLTRALSLLHRRPTQRPQRAHPLCHNSHQWCVYCVVPIAATSWLGFCICKLPACSAALVFVCHHVVRCRPCVYLICARFQ